MVVASAGVAGAAARSVAVAGILGASPAAEAAGPTAGLAGGTCNCESSADYTRRCGRIEECICPFRSGRNRLMLEAMGDIGNAERVELMQRLVALEVEHRDLDAVIQRLAEHSGHDQLQLTRLKRRKLLLKDQISWLQRQIDPDVLA
jgi:hypothetical protein